MTHAATTAQEVWDSLVQGNQRFITGTAEHPHQTPERRGELRQRQNPKAAVLGCSDSRVPGEIVFDCGLGDLFVVRNIGQIVNETVIATMEYAVLALGVPLIVVKAHTSCGAVAAAIAEGSADPDATTPAIRAALGHIRPAVEQEWRAHQRDSHVFDPATLDADSAGRHHASAMLHELSQRSEAIAEAVAAGRLSLVGCQYDLETGRAVPVTAIGRIQI
ncbi:MAG: carbonic anhydrase [Microbacterium sp.]